MSANLEPVFTRLRVLLKANSDRFAVTKDTTTHYGLEAPTGPATVRAWRGKMRAQKIPVAWIQIGKGYVSYHLMGVYGNPKLLAGVSKELLARMQGKSCFNFKNVDEGLFQELDGLTAKALLDMKKGGFVE